MHFSPTYIFHNKINKFMEVYSLPCLKKKKIKKKVTLVVKPINFVIKKIHVGEKYIIN